MRTLLAAFAAFLYLLTPVYAFPAHNPSWVDHPDIPNCTLTGPNSYENNPDCETYVRMPNGGQSMVSHVGSGNDCPEMQTLLEVPTDCGGGDGICLIGDVWDPDNQICVPDDRCPAGQHWDDTMCVENENPICGIGEIYNPQTDECISEQTPICDPGEHYDQNLEQCISDDN